MDATLKCVFITINKSCAGLDKSPNSPNTNNSWCSFWIIAFIYGSFTTSSCANNCGFYSTSILRGIIINKQRFVYRKNTQFSVSRQLYFSITVDQTDLLRRELDNRFLDRSGLTQPITIPPGSSSANTPTSMNNSISGNSAQTTPPGSGNNTPGPPQGNGPFLRQELHHHQHQHTHLHQHQHQHQSLLPAAPSASLFPPPLFKDIPKIGAVDSPFYRTGPAIIGGMPPYPYGSGILHPGLSGPTQFVPPSHLQSFVPKVSIF